MLAPIILFTYNRLYHTQKTVDALSSNLLAKESELFIYSDAPKNEDEEQAVNDVREYIKNIEGFKSVEVIQQETNLGLPNSIALAVTEIVNRFGKVIVVEDDIVTSPYFLTFMNDSLEYYEDNKKVWHVSGWNFPIKTDGLDDTFFWRAAQVWGWGTWKDRWQYYRREPALLIDTFSEYDIYKYNLDDVMHRWENEVIRNREGTLNTWACFWYATIFKNNGLCLHPAQTFVENIGRDGSGTTNGNDSENLYSSKELCNRKLNLTNNVYENDLAVFKIKSFWQFLIEKKENSINQNLVFSKQYNILLNQLEYIKKKGDKYIIYGAGNLGKLIFSYMPESIDFIVDANEKIQGTQLGSKMIYPVQKLKDNIQHKIIISVLGREIEIKKLLQEEYRLPEKRIVLIKI